MLDPKNVKLVPSEAWLRRVADEEDQVASISVGGLVTRLGMYPQANDSRQVVFGELVQLIRRKEGLTVEQLALLAKVQVDELKLVERGIVIDAELIQKLANSLRLSADKLAQLAGVAPATDPDLEKAARRFESTLHSAAVLSPVEESALKEFMQSIGD